MNEVVKFKKVFIVKPFKIIDMNRVYSVKKLIKDQF